MVLLAGAAAASCTDRCILNGEVEGVSDGMIVAYDMFSNGEAVDSTEIRNGKFRLEFSDQRPRLMDLRVGQEPVGMFFTENGRLKMTGNPCMGEAMVKGSPANEALSEFNATYYEYCRRYGQVADEETRLSIREDFDRLMDDAYRNNRDNVFGLHVLIQMGDLNMSVREVLDALEALPENLRGYDFVQKAMKQCRIKLSVSVGGDYIDIEHEDTDGNSVSLSSVVSSGRYKYVLLDFWASWCAPCRDEIPYQKKAYDRFHDRGFEIYGVSWDSSAEAWKKTVEKYGMKWINVSPLAENGKAFRDYAINTIPDCYMIECPSGKIVAVKLRGEELEKFLEENLK